MKDLIKNLKKMWYFLKDQKWKMVLIVVLNIFLIGISVLVPILSAKVIIRMTNSEYKQLIYVALVILIVEVCRNIIYFIERKYYQIIYRETFTKMQISLGKEILKLENSCLDDKGTGVFIQRLTGDTSRIAEIFNVLADYLEGIVTNIGVFGAMLIINKWVCLYMVITTLIMFVFETKKNRKFNEEDKIFRKEQEKLSSFLSEIIRGMRDIKMLNSEDSFLNEFKNRSVDVNNRRYTMNSIRRKYNLINGNLSDLTNFLLIALLTYFMISGRLLAASALVLYNYSGRVSSICYYVSNIMEKVKDFNLSSTRVFDIMLSDEFKKETFGTEHINKLDGNFEFKDVHFSYKDNEILKGLDFKIKSGETVAFVGKSGAGKTTIFNLLCKMYNVKDNQVFLDGYDVNKLDKDSIRGNITIISQTPYIFNLSIKDNLRLVKEDLTDKEMINACKTACLDEYINTLPDKYDTIIGEGGVNLSGGQKQRLAIARALIQKTKIILFDEATSALDNETQANIQKAIDNMKGEYTILIIAHRLSTIVNADRILFLNNGKIENSGSHKSLMKNCEEYRKLYESEIKSNQLM